MKAKSRQPRVRRPRKTINTTIGSAPWLIVFRRDIDGRWKSHWGQTYWEKREIHIDPRVFNPNIDKQYTEVVTPREIALHEFIHAYMPWLDEDYVNIMAKEADSYLDDFEL